MARSASSSSVRDVASAECVFNEVVTSEQVNFIRIGQTTIREWPITSEPLMRSPNLKFGAVALYYWSDTKSSALDFGVLARLVLPYAPT